MIEAFELSKTYGRFRVLDRISLSVGAGEFVGLFGRNGAGKTTFLKILSLLLKPSDGRLTIQGMSPDRHSHSILRSIGMVSHQVYLYNDLTSRENLRFYARLYDVDHVESTIDHLLEKVGLASRAKEPVRRFSRGMLQRLSIARVLLHKPALLLMDEPYTGLDQKACTFLDGILSEYHQLGNTVIMVSHDIAHAVTLARRAVVFDRGRIAIDSTTPLQDLDDIKAFVA